MNILTIIIIITLCFFSFRITRDIIHPAVVTCGIWGLIIIIYNFINHGLYALSDKFYFALLLWLITFCIASLWISKIYVPFPSFLKGKPNRQLIKYLFPVTIFCLLVSIFALIHKGLLYNPDNFFAGIRTSSVSQLNGEFPLMEFPFYIDIANAISGFSFLFILLIVFIENKKIDTKLIIIIVLALTYFVLRSSKTVMAQILLSFFCMLFIYKKINLKRIGLFFLFFFVFMMLSQLLRRSGGGFNFTQFITAYSLAPLSAFDTVLMGHAKLIHSFNGEYTFRFLIPFFQYFDPSIIGNPDPFNLYNWTKTPVEVNVYTIMFSYYVDFGFWGLFVFSSLFGAFWGLLYQFMKAGYGVCILIYSAFFYMLIFQFFSDSFFQFFFVTLSIILVSCLLFVKIKIKKENG